MTERNKDNEIKSWDSRIAMKYFFHRDDLKRWREIDREVRALVRSFYEAGHGAGQKER